MENTEITNSTENISISAEEYLKLKANEDQVLRLNEELNKLKNDFAKLKLDSSIGKNGSYNEAKQLALYISEMNDFLKFLGKDVIDFGDENITDIRSYIIALLETIRDELRLDEWFSQNEDILIIIKNLKQEILAKQAIEAENIQPQRVVVSA